MKNWLFKKDIREKVNTQIDGIKNILKSEKLEKWETHNYRGMIEALKWVLDVINNME